MPFYSEHVTSHGIPSNPDTIVVNLPPLALVLASATAFRPTLWTPRYPGLRTTGLETLSRSLRTVMATPGRPEVRAHTAALATIAVGA